LRYKVFGFLVESDLALSIPQAHEPQPDPDYLFHLLSTEIQVTCSSFHYLTHYRADGSPWLSCSKSDFGYKLYYHDLAVCWISQDGSHIDCFPYPETPHNTLEHLLLDQLLPLVISHQSNTVLHASAVNMNGSATVFIGNTGNGKSTLTTSFCAAGFPLLADDGLLLRMDQQAIWGIGSYPGLRLWPDSVKGVFAGMPNLETVSHYNDKRRITSESMSLAFSDDPVPIAKIYLLDKSPLEPLDKAIAFERLSPSASIIALLERSFRLDTNDQQRNRQELDRLTELASRVPVYRLNYPRQYKLLPSVCEAVQLHLGNDQHIQRI
jgi:hypothetical protein